MAGGQVELIGTELEGENLAWWATIDTSAAGFISPTPFYFATLVEHPFIDLNDADSPLLPLLRQVLGPFISIQSPSTDNFIFEVRFAISAGSDSTGTTIEIENPNLKVNWFGIESVSGCPPPPTFYVAAWLQLIVAPLSATIGSNITFFD
jgi:hypothetical protein